MGKVNYLGHWTAGESGMWRNHPLAFQGFIRQLDASLSCDLEGKQVNRMVKLIVTDQLAYLKDNQ